MIRTNLAQAPCSTCSAPLKPREGRLVESGGKWLTFCVQHADGAVVKPLRRRVVLLVKNGKPYAEEKGRGNPEDWKLLSERAQEAGCRFAGSKLTFRLDDVDRIREALERFYAVEIDMSLTVARERNEAARTGAIVATDARLEKIEAAVREKTGKSLMTIQREGTQWLAPRISGLHADLAGAGKTPQVLCAIPEGVFVIVVCPASVRGSWANEFATWRPEIGVFDIEKTEGKLGEDWIQNPGYALITNYERLPEDNEIGTLPIGTVVIFDEIHKVRNKGTIWHRAWALAKAARAVGGRSWGMSGDPLFNKPDDLYNILEVLNCHDVFGSIRDFRRLFNASQDYWGKWSYGMPDPKVAQLLKTVMLRRPSELFERMLPKATIKDVEVEVWEEVHRACDEAMAKLAKLGVDLRQVMMNTEANKATRIAFQEISKVYAQIAAAKVPAALELIEPLEQQGEPVVVLSTHVAPLKAIGEREGWAVMTGGTPAGRRKQIIDDFQNGRLRGLAASIHACGFGITLTRSCYTINLDEDWVPANNRQARKRCVLEDELVHTRIGVKPIQDVVVGEEVLTHTGQWKKVTDKSGRGIYGNGRAGPREHVVEISYARHADPLRVTHDHELLVARLSETDPAWVQAQDVRPGDSLVMPRPTWNEVETRKVSTDRYKIKTTKSPGKGYNPLPSTVELDDDMLFAMGWYLAEGCCIFPKVKNGKRYGISCVSFSGHVKERAILERVKKRIEQLGITCTWVKKNTCNKNALELRAWSIEMANWFKDWFGSNSRTKRIPAMVMDLPTRRLGILLSAYISGDGYVRKDGKPCVEWVTVSRTLAYQTTLVSARLGFEPTIRWVSEKPGRSKQWICGYSTKSAKPQSSNFARSNKSMILNPVRSVTIMNGERKPRRKVWDLTVEDDHSFVVGLASVHNCHRLTQTRPVTHYRLVANHYLDRRIQEINDEKLALFLATVEAAVTPGTAPEPIAATNLDLTPLAPPAPKRIVVPKRGQVKMPWIKEDDA